MKTDFSQIREKPSKKSGKMRCKPAGERAYNVILCLAKKVWAKRQSFS